MFYEYLLFIICILSVLFISPYSIEVFWWSLSIREFKYPVIIRHAFNEWLLVSLNDITIPIGQWRLINTGVKIWPSIIRPHLDVKLVMEKSDRFGWEIINYGYNSKNELYVIVFNNNPKYPTRIHPGDPFLIISNSGLLFAFRNIFNKNKEKDEEISNIE